MKGEWHQLLLPLVSGFVTAAAAALRRIRLTEKPHKFYNLSRSPLGHTTVDEINFCYAPSLPSLHPFPFFSLFTFHIQRECEKVDGGGARIEPKRNSAFVCLPIGFAFASFLIAI